MKPRFKIGEEVIVLVPHSREKKERVFGTVLAYPFGEDENVIDVETEDGRVIRITTFRDHVF